MKKFADFLSGRGAEPAAGNRGAPERVLLVMTAIGRTTLTGAVLDAPDANELAAFYRELLDWGTADEEPGWVKLVPPGGGAGLAFQTEPRYVRPVWPTRPGAQGMMAHLDIEVDDLTAAGDRAVALGAVLAQYQPQDDVRVWLDPAGHPFCFWVRNEPAPAEPVPRIIAFTGLPGTGKSTLADRVAAAVGAPAFAGDWLLGALKPHGVLTGLERPAFLAMYYDLLRTLVERQLTLRQSAVTDCLLDDAVAARWGEVARLHSARLHVVECVCGDREVHRSRIEGRVRAIPGWHEVGWGHVERMRDEFPPLTVERLVVDAMDPVEDNLRLVLRHVGA